MNTINRIKLLLNNFFLQKNAILWLLLLALGIRVLLIVCTHQEPLSDAYDYHILALNISDHGIFGYNTIHTAYRPIGYPFLLSLVYTLFPFYKAGQILQSLLIILSGYLIYHIILFIKSNKKSAIVGAFIWLFIPVTIGQSLLLLSEPLCTLLLLLSTYILLISTKKYWHFISGIILGYSILTRPTALIPIVIVLLIYLYKKKTIFKKVVPSIIVIFIGILCAITPWMIRNYAVFGKPQLATNGGINFWIGNNEQANGSYKLTHEPPELFNIKNEIQRDSIGYALGLKYIEENPQKAILLIPKKIAFMWSSDMYMILSFLKSETNNKSYKQIAASVPLQFSLIALLPSLILLIYGWYSLGYVASTEYGKLSISFIIIWTCVHIVFFGSARYHEPLLPFFIIAIALLSFTKISHKSNKYYILPIVQCMLFIAEMIFIYY
jgi:4-amino-4-deoxy-L-arabinose transferase-like glycosyltransferase